MGVWCVPWLGKEGVGVWCVPWLGKEGGGCLMGPDEQPSVQKWTITDCHHPHTHIQVACEMKGDCWVLDSKQPRIQLRSFYPLPFHSFSAISMFAL